MLCSHGSRCCNGQWGCKFRTVRGWSALCKRQCKSSWKITYRGVIKESGMRIRKLCMDQRTHFKGSSTAMWLDVRWQWSDPMDTKSRRIFWVTQSQLQKSLEWCEANSGRRHPWGMACPVLARAWAGTGVMGHANLWEMVCKLRYSVTHSNKQ